MPIGSGGESLFRWAQTPDASQNVKKSPKEQFPLLQFEGETTPPLSLLWKPDSLPKEDEAPKMSYLFDSAVKPSSPSGELPSSASSDTDKGDFSGLFYTAGHENRHASEEHHSPHGVTRFQSCGAQWRFALRSWIATLQRRSTSDVINVNSVW